jgi:selenocysteine lyase/cysteine desulfurase
LARAARCGRLCAHNRLDLKAVQPDFVTVSFYKMFGYPTGVGALLIRRHAFAKLRRPWFAGGTVNFASVQGQAHVLAPAEAAFEDGTLNYLSIPAVEIGLRHLQAIGMEIITERVRCLTGWVLDQLLALRHSNGRAMVRIYGPTTTQARGGTVTLNFTTQKDTSWITDASRNWPDMKVSRYALVASAIPASARLPRG